MCGPQTRPRIRCGTLARRLIRPTFWWRTSLWSFRNPCTSLSISQARTVHFIVPVHVVFVVRLCVCSILWRVCRAWSLVFMPCGCGCGGNATEGYICSTNPYESPLVYDLLPPEFQMRRPTLALVSAKLVREAHSQMGVGRSQCACGLQAGRLDKMASGLVLLSQSGACAVFVCMVANVVIGVRREGVRKHRHVRQHDHSSEASRGEGVRSSSIARVCCCVCMHVSLNIPSIFR